MLTLLTVQTIAAKAIPIEPLMSFTMYIIGHIVMKKTRRFWQIEDPVSFS